MNFRVVKAKRAVNVGGNWNNGDNVSPLYWNGNNTPSETNINVGARVVFVGLEERREICKAFTALPKGKIAQKTGRLVAEILRTLISANNEPNSVILRGCE